MKVNLRNIFFVLPSLAFLLSCSSGDNGNAGETTEEKGRSETQSVKCRFDDGGHKATVEYYNPDTGHSATYDLEVEVDDCQVTTIYFPKGGRLDNSHIDPEELDSDGNATIQDDRGRTYEIHIDN